MGWLAATDDAGSGGTPEKPEEGRAAAATKADTAKMAAGEERAAEMRLPHSVLRALLL